MRNWAAWVGVKYGTLTVEKYLGYLNKSHAYYLVRCDCGKTKKVITGDFVRGKTKSCGLLECKRKVAKLLALPEPPKGDGEQNREVVSAIEQRIKPKYFCKSVAPECTISTLLHICCCECDRPCKRCENTPQKCGARERKKN